MFLNKLFLRNLESSLDITTKDCVGLDKETLRHRLNACMQPIY